MCPSNIEDILKRSASRLTTESALGAFSRLMATGSINESRTCIAFPPFADGGLELVFLPLRKFPAACGLDMIVFCFASNFASNLSFACQRDGKANGLWH